MKHWIIRTLCIHCVNVLYSTFYKCERESDFNFRWPVQYQCKSVWVYHCISAVLLMKLMYNMGLHY